MKKIISTLLCALMLNISMPIGIFAMDNVTTTEHLQLPKKVAQKTPVDTVNVLYGHVDLLQYNTFQVAFAEDFNSKYAVVGDKINFILPEDLKTQEGTLVLPEGTKIVTQISNIEKPKTFNRSGKIYLDFRTVELPDGTVLPLKAKVFNKKGYLARGKVNALGKGLGSTLGGMALGTGIGCGIGVAASAVIVGGFAIGMPVGFAIGAAVGLIAPGLTYKVKAGDKITIQITDTIVVDK